MSVVANVAINVDASGAVRQLGAVNTAANAVAETANGLGSKISAGLSGLGGKLQAFGSQFTNLGSSIASLGAGAALGGFIKAGVEAGRTDKKINALAGQYNEASKLTTIANDAAKTFGIGQTTAANAVSDLYGRLRPMGISLGNIGKTFTGVNKAAALMNLSAADTDGVMLQLSQAMGSGALQGDELRSVMERLPAVGQAIAKTMGVTVGEIKQLGADGKITTDIIIQAMDELNKIQPPPPDAVRLYQQASEDLATAIGTKLMPVFTPLLKGLTQVINSFTALPQPVQTVIVAIGGTVAALAAIAAPLGFAISGIGSLISAAAGMGPALAGVASALGVVGKVLLGVFTGPVGWVALLVAAGVAVYAFRDKIGGAFKALGTIITEAAKAFKAIFIDPVIRWNRFLYDKSIEIFSKMAEIVKRPFQAIASFIRTIINGIMGGIQVSINNAVLAINVLIRGANRALAALKLPQIPQVPTVSLPRFADGGYVTKPTVALIGEGGEPEYVVPQSKAANFAANYLAGQRGAAAVPNGSMPNTAQINIRTGPVLQQDNARYVTVKDMEQALQTMADTLLGSVRSAGGRRYVGLT